MNSIVQPVIKLSRKIGMDKSIAYSSGSRVIQGLAGVGSVFFISTFLTDVEQGFYFTFGSILALQVFFELGLTGIMTQFIAHEVSHLYLNEQFEYVGDAKYKSRLASLVQFCVKWYSLLSVFVLTSLLIVGFVYFKRYGSEHDNVNWQAPWLLICIATAIKLFQSPFNSILMGLGKVKEMSKIGFWQQVILPSTIWIGLAMGFKLYVVGVSYMVSVILWQIFVRKSGLERILLNLWKEQVNEKVSYLKEIFPFQWKIALSWVSGYFIFQLYNPVLFATEGAIVAGQMGMTMQALNAIQAFSLSWLNTKVPLYSKLIALKEYVKLDIIFNRTLKQMSFVCLLLLLAFWFVLFVFKVSGLEIGDVRLADRFLDLIPLFFLIIPAYIRQFTNSWATYLRCHKKEPYLLNSILSGLANCVAVLYFGKKYGLYGIILSSLVIYLLFLPWGYWIFKTKKKEWHG